MQGGTSRTWPGPDQGMEVLEGRSLGEKCYDLLPRSDRMIVHPEKLNEDVIKVLD